MSTRDVAHVALFAALTAALAVFPPLALPLIGVPITAQSLGPMLAGAITGPRRGMLSQVLFLVLVALGLPLLAGGRGGLGVFASPSGGYLLGFAGAALVTGWLFQRYWERVNLAYALAFVFAGGIVVIHVLGIAWVSVVTDLSPWQAAVAGAPFLPGDLLKVGTAAAIAVTVRRSYPLMPVPART